MNFILSDIAAILSLFKNRRFKDAMTGIKDIISCRAVDGMIDKNDKTPFRRYIRLKLFKK